MYLGTCHRTTIRLPDYLGTIPPARFNLLLFYFEPPPTHLNSPQLTSPLSLRRERPHPLNPPQSTTISRTNPPLLLLLIDTLDTYLPVNDYYQLPTSNLQPPHPPSSDLQSTSLRELILLTNQNSHLNHTSRLVLDHLQIQYTESIVSSR